MCTGMIAFVCGVIFARRSTGSIVRDSSISTSTGTAPTASGAAAVLTHVYAGTSTSSPGPMPAPTRATISALVPLLTARACRTPIASASCLSKRSVRLVPGAAP